MAAYRRLRAGDDATFAGLVMLFNEAFEAPDPNSVNRENIRDLLSNPHFVCFAALVDHAIAGGITAYELPMYDREGSSMYIYDLAVGKPYRRQGIGTALVQEVMAYCREQSIREVFVQADEADRHAVAFYRNIGGVPSRTFQFSFDV